jgi:hypothetical protein
VDETRRIRKCACLKVDDLASHINHGRCLRIPVLILALLVLLVCAVEVGGFAIELSSRARAARNALRSLARQVVANPEQAAALSARAPSCRTFGYARGGTRTPDTRIMISRRKLRLALLSAS